MKLNKYDVIVIGAGPAGSVTARFLALQGFSVLLIEKRPVIGAPVRCGEASTHRKELAIFGDIPEDAFETDIDGSIIYAAGYEIHIPTQGVMLDRLKFDLYLAQNAEKAGAEVVCSARAIHIEPVLNGKRKVTIHFEGRDIQVDARCVVGADGAESLAGRWIGLKTRQLAPQTGSAISFELDVLDSNPTKLKGWIGAETIDEGYIWSFPKLKSRRTNFGCGLITPKLGDRNAYEIADQWREKIYPGSKILHVGGGAVPISATIDQTVADHFVLVGDAAHHTNPLTGAGIAPGMHAGKIAAKVIGQCIHRNDLSQQALAVYEGLVWEKFGRSHYRNRLIYEYMLTNDKNEQKKFYKVLKSAADKGKIETLLRYPISTIRLAYDYMNIMQRIPK